MSQFLHIRAFTGRPAAMGAHVVAHGINPMSQPTLNRIPTLSLVDAYAQGEAYQYGVALAAAAGKVLGVELARSVVNDLLVLNDSGLDRLTPSASEKLRVRYAAFDHPAAREIVDWLDGGYRITQEIMDTQ
jgi:hypothetical protein